MKPRLRKRSNNANINEPGWEGMTKSGKQSASKFSQGLTLKVVSEMLCLSDAARGELLKCDTSDFNIFNLRHLTDGRELEAVHAFIMVKRDCV
jgi:hypothetical protein